LVLRAKENYGSASSKEFSISDKVLDMFRVQNVLSYSTILRNLKQKYVFFLQEQGISSVTQANHLKDL